MTQLWSKIDRSFIQDIHHDQNDASIAKSIIGLAHNMMLNVVAEGVETEGAHELLQSLGCDEVQGYLFARPLPTSDFESWLGARRQ